jgi:2,3-bisphosphoglycerate-independent phosphoglycerate mutase
MKYCVLIIDGAADLPVPGHGDKTCFELAKTPNLDAMARKGELGLARTIPEGIEPSSSNACMSVLGYDPSVHRIGRAAIEAKSLGIAFNKEDSLFRCNLVSVIDGKMADYSAGHITTEEARQLIEALNSTLGNNNLHFYPGLAYRHIARMMGRQDVLQAECTPPHDISGKPVKEYLPKGPGSDYLLDLMNRSEKVLKEHPVNIARKSRGELPATTIWLFWGSGLGSGMPSFKQTYGLNAAVTSAVDVIKGLAGMLEIDAIEVSGVTDGMDNNFTGQAEAALDALKAKDMVVIHVEATDEAGHEGSADEKIEAIQITDREIIGRIRAWEGGPLRVLIMPDHPTPIIIRTHNADPVPFLLWGDGIDSNGAKRFTEKEATGTGLFLDPGFAIMARLIGKK